MIRLRLLTFSHEMRQSSSHCCPVFAHPQNFMGYKTFDSHIMCFSLSRAPGCRDLQLRIVATFRRIAKHIKDWRKTPRNQHTYQRTSWKTQRHRKDCVEIYKDFFCFSYVFLRPQYVPGSLYYLPFLWRKRFALTSWFLGLVRWQSVSNITMPRRPSNPSKHATHNTCPPICTCRSVQKNARNRKTQESDFRSYRMFS